MKPVVVKNLSKKFKMYPSPWYRGLEWMLLGKKCFHEPFWALRDINFSVNSGECLGIIGPNGAGKSTLLKILSRSLYPTSGTFSVQGRVLSLLELGTGFHPDLTGRQNLYNSATLLGFPTDFIDDRIDVIKDFSELEDFFDRPLRLYSSGMYIRLAFSMFVSLRPEILIIDEALSVGDVFFQQKSFSIIKEMVAGNTTCLFVSHDTNAILHLCTEAILLKDGRIESRGAPQDVVSLYLASVGRIKKTVNKIRSIPLEKTDGELDTPEMIRAHDILNDSMPRSGAQGMVIEALRVTNCKRRDVLQVEMEEVLSFHVLVRAHEDIHEPSVGIRVFDRFGNRVFAAGTRQLDDHLPDLVSGDELIVRLDLTFNVEAGEYSFGIGASEPSSEGPNVGFIHDRIEMLGPIAVTSDPREPLPFFGLAKLPLQSKFSLHSGTDMGER